MEKTPAEFAVHVKQLEAALLTLDEVLMMEWSKVVRDAAIQRFEYCFELVWKLIKRRLKLDGIEANSPRQAIRYAFETGYIEDVDFWFELLEDRNLTTHTYNAEIADKVFESAKRLPAASRALLQRM